MSAQDKGLLELLAGYSGAVVFTYDEALRDAPLPSADRPALMRFRAAAIEMDGALRSALEQAGGTPPPRAVAPAPASQGPGAEAYLRSVVQHEEALMGGWYAALQKLADQHLVAGAAAYMAAGGRRLVVLRRMAGLPLLPRAFETGS